MRTLAGAGTLPLMAFVHTSAFAPRAPRASPASAPRRPRATPCQGRHAVHMGLRSKIAGAISARVSQVLGDRRTDGADGGKADEEPPPGLMLGTLLAEVHEVAEGKLSGRLGQFMTAAQARVTGRAESVESVSVETEGLMNGKLGALSSISEEDASSALSKLKDMVSSGGGQAVGAAVATALQAVGVGADDDDDDLEASVGTPSEPAFEPVTALILAGYSFQAYLSPPRGAYWETYLAAVPGSAMSERTKQCVRTRVAYPCTQSLGRSACGVFMVRVETVDAVDGVKPLDERYFVSALLNDRALHHGNALEGGKTDFSLLKRIRNMKSDDDDRDDEADSLTFGVYESEASFDEGGTLLGIATVSLDNLVADAKGKPGGARGGAQLVVFEVPSVKSVEENFFETDILPEGMQLPFAMPSFTATNALEEHGGEVEEASISVQVTYIPFDMPSSYTEDEDIDEDETEEEDSEDPEGGEISPAEVAVISETMKDGDMPLDWQNLAKKLHETVERLQEASRLPNEHSIREDMTRVRFIASPDTDTEVWLWHDRKKKQVVVSFRGTEQTKWKDFVTDSLVFLQSWTPGEEINLDIQAGKTMGLDMWDVLRNGSKKGKEDDVSAMPCCHWGFLRAYLSLRDSVDHALAELTDNFAPEYSFFFTGHSLGGALATLSAADTQARRGYPDAPLDIVMMNFGSPRVGNRAFCRAYNALVPNSFRIVNGSDLVARMPQTPPRLRGGFRHVGRTVLVEEDGDVWVQGEDGEAGEGSFPEPDIEKLDGLLARERQMWALLVSGKSLGHHMEDSYFVSMKCVVEKLFA